MLVPIVAFVIAVARDVKDYATLMQIVKEIRLILQKHDYRGFVECFCESTDALCWLARGEFFEWQTHSKGILGM